MRVRRVVTGHDRNGKSVFASDEEVDPLTVELIPGAEFHRLWGADQAPVFPPRTVVSVAYARRLTRHQSA